MADKVSIGYRLAVSKCTDQSGDKGLILWERDTHSTEWTALGKIGKSSGHIIDMKTLTVEPSIMVGSLHGYITNCIWQDV